MQRHFSPEYGHEVFVEREAGGANWRVMRGKVDGKSVPVLSPYDIPLTDAESAERYARDYCARWGDQYVGRYETGADGTRRKAAA